MNHVSAIVANVGAKDISVFIRICSQRPVEENFVILKNHRKLSPSHNSPLNPVIENTPNNYKNYQLSRRFEKRNNQE